MPAHFPLFDAPFLSSMIGEFRDTMRRLLRRLCDELEGPYRRPSLALRIPIGLFRAVGSSLRREDFANWKVVGWIEELNDLVYLLDVREQLRGESDRQGFAEAFYAACEAQFYEHGYLAELFPSGPQASGLFHRLTGLCRKLAEQAVQESVFLVPGVPCRWLEDTRGRAWSVPLYCGPDFERAELSGCIAYGMEGGYLVAPGRLQQGIKNSHGRVHLLITPRTIDVVVGAQRYPLFALESSPQWRWPVVPPWHIGHIGMERQPAGALTLGPTLVYGKDRVPIQVRPSTPKLAARLERALNLIQWAWPDGAGNLAMLTTRIVPLRARGVVSFSYRHRPGLSCINCFDRDDFDLIDDLIHENSHHQLNLYLRKAELIQGDRNQEIFYSPWRRSLRPLRGILHATFTFTMGAMLFERLSSHGNRLTHMLSKADLLRARARCMEEIASVQYSFEDLDWAARREWLTEAGITLVDALKRKVKQAATRIAPYEAGVKRSRYGSELQRHKDELARAAELYRSARKPGG